MRIDGLRLFRQTAARSALLSSAQWWPHPSWCQRRAARHGRSPHWRNASPAPADAGPVAKRLSGFESPRLFPRNGVVLDGQPDTGLPESQFGDGRSVRRLPRGVKRGRALTSPFRTAWWIGQGVIRLSLRPPGSPWIDLPAAIPVGVCARRGATCSSHPQASRSGRPQPGAFRPAPCATSRCRKRRPDRRSGAGP